MRLNLFRYIFILFVIILIIISVYYLKKDDKPIQGDNTNGEATETILTDLRLAVVSLDNMNPILSKNQNVQDISKLICEPLFNITENFRLEPCLATEWAKVDSTTYLVKLRENVVWQDGSQFTVEDVKFTIDKIKDNKNESIYRYNLANLIELEIIDEYTLKIKLNKEEPFFEYNLTFPIISKSFFDNEDFLKTDKNNYPLGTGRYKFVALQENTIELAKNENWWNIENKNGRIEKITINKYNSMGEVYNDFRLGNVDLLTTNTLVVENYIGTIGFIKIDCKGREYDYLSLNCKNKFLKDEKVRNAVNYAIDTQAIINNVFYGRYYETKFPLDYGNFAYTAIDTQNYDLEKAKKILKDDGWTLKNKVWQKKVQGYTQQLSLNLVVKNTDDNALKTADLIKKQLESFGIKIDVYEVSENRYEDYLEDKNYDMIITGIYNSNTPNLETFFGNDNISNYSNKEIKNIIKEAKDITDDNLLHQKYAKIIEIYQKQLPFIGLYRSKNTLVHTPSLRGNISPNNYNIFYNVETWYRQAQ